MRVPRATSVTGAGGMSRRGWVLFLAMSVIWGVPYLLIKVSVEEISPSTLVLARTALAASVLLPIALARGQIRPLLPRWRLVAFFAAVEIAVPWLLLGYAEQRLSSSLTGLLVAAVPLVGAVLARYGPTRERLGGRRLVGLLVGFAGVASLVGFEVGGGDGRAVLAVAVVAIAYATGPVILARGLADVPGLGVIAASLTLTALVYLPTGVAQAPVRWPSADAVAAVMLLASVSTALAFLLFFRLIAEVGPARSTVITYVNPAVAVLLGVLLLDEAFTAATAVGFGLILAGSVLATGGRAGVRPTEAAQRLHGAGRPATKRWEREGAPLETPSGS
jgi:drug/metabolite transporter (DMT)-like permease